jgi:hypothetical protein
VLAIKTPLAFLIFMQVGAISLVRRNVCEFRWQHFLPIALMVAVLTTMTLSTVNLGVRHILPVYPFMSVVAAFGASSLWNCERFKVALRVLVLLLAGWHFAEGASCHPDYLSYFNEFARDQPDAFVVDSDLDWGQDLGRLREAIRRHHIDRFSIAYFGTADVARHNLGNFQRLTAGVPTTGWIAISITALRTESGYSWLDEFQPVETVGSSIRLFFVPGNEPERPVTPTTLPASSLPYHLAARGICP